MVVVGIIGIGGVLVVFGFFLWGLRFFLVFCVVVGMVCFDGSMWMCIGW